MAARRDAADGSTLPPAYAIVPSMGGWRERARGWARGIKRDIAALWLAARDPRVPWSAKAVAASVVAYALSPVDLIPDVIPVLGYLDDLIIVPLGILLAVRLVPSPLMAEFRTAAARLGARPASRIGLAMVVALWLAAGVLLAAWGWRHLVAPG